MTPLNSKLILITVIVLTLFFTACGGGHDHGPTPNGLELIVNGEVIAIQEGTEITYHNNANAIVVPEGESLEVRVQFFLEDGERYDYRTDDGYSLRFNITDTNVLQADHPINNDEWLMHLRGESAGTSVINFELWHVDHSDFDSRNFNVQVSAPDVD